MGVDWTLYDIRNRSRFDLGRHEHSLIFQLAASDGLPFPGWMRTMGRDAFVERRIELWMSGNTDRLAFTDFREWAARPFDFCEQAGWCVEIEADCDQWQPWRDLANSEAWPYTGSTYGSDPADMLAEISEANGCLP